MYTFGAIAIDITIVISISLLVTTSTIITTAIIITVMLRAELATTLVLRSSGEGTYKAGPCSTALVCIALRLVF